MTTSTTPPVDPVREALEEIHAWLVCWPIASADDMAQSFPLMEKIANVALASHTTEQVADELKPLSGMTKEAAMKWLDELRQGSTEHAEQPIVEGEQSVVAASLAHAEKWRDWERGAEQPAVPVAWCALTHSGQIAYFDGKPMVMPGPVGNEHHTVPLYAWQPAVPTLTPPPMNDTQLLAGSVSIAPAIDDAWLVNGKWKPGALAFVRAAIAIRGCHVEAQPQASRHRPGRSTGARSVRCTRLTYWRTRMSTEEAKHTPGPEQVDRLRHHLQYIMHQVDELELKTGQGGWYAETIQETCDAIAKDFGFHPYHEGFAADAEGARRHKDRIAKATGSAA